MTPMISYAQNFEDVILERIFKGQSDGFYIDIGACHPIYDSVTHHFYLKGWRGINLEPQPGLFAELAAVRPRDINLECCAGQQAGQMKLAITKDIGTSTLDPELVDLYRRDQSVVAEISVSVVTLNQVWEEHVGTRKVDFLKIDVEGFEKNVLLGADFERVSPSLVVIEATRPNSETLCYEQWEYLLLEHYDFFYFDGLNRFYQRKGLSLPGCESTLSPNVFDQFKPYPQFLLEQANASLQQDRLELTHQLQGAQAQIVDKETALAAAADAYQDLQFSFQAKVEELQGALALLQNQEAAQNDRVSERASATELAEPAGQLLLEQFNAALLTEREDLRDQLKIALAHLVSKEEALTDAANAYQALHTAFQVKDDELRGVLDAWRGGNAASAAPASDHLQPVMDLAGRSSPLLLEQFNAILLDEREALREQLNLVCAQSTDKEHALADAADAYQSLQLAFQAKEGELQHIQALLQMAFQTQESEMQRVQEILLRKEQELLEASQACQRSMSAHELQHQQFSNTLQQHSLNLREAKGAYEDLQNLICIKDAALAEAAQAHACLRAAFDEKIRELEELHAALAAQSPSDAGEVKESH